MEQDLLSTNFLKISHELLSPLLKEGSSSTNLNRTPVKRQYTFCDFPLKFQYI